MLLFLLRLFLRVSSQNLKWQLSQNTRGYIQIPSSCFPTMVVEDNLWFRQNDWCRGHGNGWAWLSPHPYPVGARGGVRIPIKPCSISNLNNEWIFWLQLCQLTDSCQAKCLDILCVICLFMTDSSKECLRVKLSWKLAYKALNARIRNERLIAVCWGVMEFAAIY